MNEDDADNVKRLPVRFKQPVPEERSLVAPWEVGAPSKCNHYSVGYIVDASAAQVECGKCGEKLNPMWVLGQLASDDRRFAESQKRYQEEMERLSKRARTKCQYCGSMTRISQR